jgi:hypothetical protein
MGLCWVGLSEIKGQEPLTLKSIRSTSGHLSSGFWSIVEAESAAALFAGTIGHNLFDNEFVKGSLLKCQETLGTEASSVVSRNSADRP